MPYGRTPEQEIMLEAHRAINFRRYYGDGRWGAKPGIYRTTGRQGGDWLIRKIKPKGIVWAKNTDMHATKVHAVRYQLQATKGERSRSALRARRRSASTRRCHTQRWPGPVAFDRSKPRGGPGL